MFDREEFLSKCYLVQSYSARVSGSPVYTLSGNYVLKLRELPSLELVFLQIFTYRNVPLSMVGTDSYSMNCNLFKFTTDTRIDESAHNYVTMKELEEICGNLGIGKDKNGENVLKCFDYFTFTTDFIKISCKQVNNTVDSLCIEFMNSDSPDNMLFITREFESMSAPVWSKPSIPVYKYKINGAKLAHIIKAPMLFGDFYLDKMLGGYVLSFGVSDFSYSCLVILFDGRILYTTYNGDKGYTKPEFIGKLWSTVDFLMGV